ncbi:MAG: tetratricopeptide repeat protein, partial [Gammaproteobacteria bacterium]|nr:tetratricopeptide repeat protein [Gammaproteobacteria bacterium]
MTLRITATTTNHQFKQRLRAETAILPTTESEIDLLHKALVALRRAQYERAESIYRDVMVASPHNPDALHGLGVIELQRGQPARAVELFEQAIATGKVPGQFFVNYAVALENSGRDEEALQTLKRGASQHQQEAILHQSLGVFLHNRKRDDESLRSLERAERLNSELPRLQLMLADLHFEHTRHTKALKHYRLNLEQYPGDKHSLARSAYILGTDGKHQEALDLLMPIYEDGTEDPDVCNNIGSALIMLGKIDEAEKYILRAQELDPNRWEFNSNIAGLHLHREDLDGAIKVFLRLKKKYPDEPRTIVDLGMAYMRQGRSEEAMKEILEVIEAHPDNDPAWTALGILHGNKFQYFEAVDAYRKAL